jgi:hypothetical protein
MSGNEPARISDAASAAVELDQASDNVVGKRVEHGQHLEEEPSLIPSCRAGYGCAKRTSRYRDGRGASGQNQIEESTGLFAAVCGVYGPEGVSLRSLFYFSVADAYDQARHAGSS